MRYSPFWTSALALLLFGLMPMAQGQTVLEQFWDGKQLVDIPNGRQSNAVPGELIVVNSFGTSIWHKSVESLPVEPAHMNVPYSKADKKFELGVFGKIFKFLPSVNIDNFKSLEVEKMKLTGTQYDEGDVDEKLLPVHGSTPTKTFLDAHRDDTVYIVTAVFNTAHLKITDIHNHSITFTSGGDVKPCTIPPAKTTPADPPKKADGSVDAPTQTGNNAGDITTAIVDKITGELPGGVGGRICQPAKGVVEIDEDTPVAMRIFRLEFSEVDDSWNLVHDSLKSLSKL